MTSLFATDPAPRRTPTVFAASVLATLVMAPAPPVLAGGPSVDAAVTSQVNRERLAVRSPATQCMDAHIRQTLKAGRRLTSTGMARDCRTKWSRTTTVRGRVNASNLVDAVRSRGKMLKAFGSGEHLSVVVRGRGPERIVVVAVSATSRHADPPRLNVAPYAAITYTDDYVRTDADHVRVTLSASGSRDVDGKVVSHAWSVIAPDGVAVPVRSEDLGWSFTTPHGGDHVVTLTVTDNDGAQSTRRVTLKVPSVTTAQKLSAMELEIWTHTNAQRAAHGLPALSWHPCLATNARRHAQNMVTAQRMYHQSPADITAACPEPTWFGLSENVLANRDGASATDLVQQWMSSPGHRANVLSPSSTHVGVGVAHDPATGTVYAAQVFYDLTP